MPTDSASARPLVAVSTSSFARVSDQPLDKLAQAGIAVRVNPHGRRLEKTEIVNLLEGAFALIAGTERLDRQTLSAAPRLQVVARCGTGLENIDLEAAADLGVAVRNTPEAHVDAVAELTLAGILDVLRSLASADRALRAGRWQKPMGRLLRGKTVGLVGLGRVGRALVCLLQPFDVQLLAHDPVADETFARDHAVTLLELDEVVAAAELLSLHLPLGPDTRHVIHQRMLERMPAGAILINCSRGGLVDEHALQEQLESGHLAGAFIDTFEHEPYKGPLTTMDNVLLTPHIGSYAAECRLRMELEAVEHVISFHRAVGR